MVPINFVNFTPCKVAMVWYVFLRWWSGCNHWMLSLLRNHIAENTAPKQLRLTLLVLKCPTWGIPSCRGAEFCVLDFVGARVLKTLRCPLSQISTILGSLARQFSWDGRPASHQIRGWAMPNRSCDPVFVAPRLKVSSMPTRR